MYTALWLIHGSRVPIHNFSTGPLGVHRDMKGHVYKGTVTLAKMQEMILVPALSTA